MRLLFMTPNHDAVSEVWMQRMREQLGDGIALVAYEHARFPPGRHLSFIDLSGRVPPMRFWRRGLRKALHVLRPPESMVQQLKRRVLQTQVDVVLCNYASMAVGYDAFLRELSMPVFVHCHGLDIHFDARSETTPEKRIHGDDYQERVVALADYAVFIANSRHSEHVLREAGVPANRIRLKYFGVPVPAACPERLNRGRVCILYLGRLLDCKGPDLVLRAFNDALARGLNGELVIAGDGPLRVTIELMRRESPQPERIRILGAVDSAQALALYRQADIFTCHHRRGPLSHREEAFGVTLIEAMAQALPVVTGRSGGVEESVIDGETGFLVAPGDVTAHADCLLRLGQDPSLRAGLGANAWRHVRDHFSPQQERDRLLEIMDAGPRVAPP